MKKKRKAILITIENYHPNPKKIIGGKEINSSPNFVEPLLQINHISGENAKVA